MRRQISEFGKIRYLEVVEWSIEKIDVCSNRCPSVHVHIYYKLVADSNTIDIHSKTTQGFPTNFFLCFNAVTEKVEVEQYQGRVIW